MKKEKLYKDRDWLEEQYVEKGLSTTEIAEKTEVNESSVWRWLQRLNIPTREAVEPAGNGKYRDKRWLKEQYVDRDLSTYQIAEKVSSSAQTISRWLHEFGIEVDEQPADVEKIEKICPVCGKKFEVGPSSVDKYKHCSNECRFQAFRGEKHPRYNRVTITCDFCGKKIKRQPSEIESREHLFCSKTCHDKWMAKNKSGEANPNWRGGYYPHYYGPNWEKRKEEILERDDHTCQICGTPQRERALDIHHIIPFREFRYPIFKGNTVKNVLAEFNWKRANRKENLVAVCQNCHPKIEGKKMNLNEFNKEEGV